MTTILENIGDFIAQAISWMQAFLSSIVGGSGTVGGTSYTYSSSPLLIIFIIAPFIGTLEYTFTPDRSARNVI